MKKNDIYKDVLDDLHVGVYFVDRKLVITYWNNGAERITGYEAQKIIGLPCRESFLKCVGYDGRQICEDRCPVEGCMADGKVKEVEACLHHTDGHLLPVLVRATPRLNVNGKIIGAVGTFITDARNTTARRREGDLRRATEMDSLTGAGGRDFLEQRLRAVISDGVHQPLSNTGVVFIDIDQLQKVNDMYGIGVGDNTLRMVVRTLEENLRKTDVVGRWGGEEFMVLLNNLTSADGLSQVAEKLRLLIQFSRLDTETVSLSITASIGATLILPNDTTGTLTRRVEELMVQSKQNGCNRVTIG